MVNLFEIMQAAQGGKACTTLAQPFGLGPEEAGKAVQAVLPALSMGLRQQAETIDGWQAILGTLAQAKASADLFDSDGAGMPDALRQQGRNALATLFGGEAATEAVAAHAAGVAGLPVTVMQQMLPMIASMVLGGLFKGAMGNGLGGLLGQMMQAGSPNAGMNTGMNTGVNAGFGALSSAFFGAPATPPRKTGGVAGLLGAWLGRQEPAPPAAGTFGAILGQMMAAGQPAPPPPDGLDSFRRMFETGREVQATQTEALRQIFSQFSGR
jgi:hypothetical protein